MRTSNHLTRGQIYTRQDLRNQFGITDATINTGIFQPKDHDSVWLFVTEQKTADRTQYKDRLVGDELRWQGQTEGRKDKLIIEHEADKLELLLFYREKPRMYPGAGFVYEGLFKYVSHDGEHPTSFVLRRVR
jgi:hypothetical protein